MVKPISKKYSVKIVSMVLVVFILLSGLILLVGGYYGKNIGQVAGETVSADPLKLAADYKDQFRRLFNNYLLLADSANLLTDDYLAKTVDLKQNLLALKVPTELKDSHLQAVMALSEIETGVKTKNLDLILPNIYKLREAIDNF